jgi:hypothetical protein
MKKIIASLILVTTIIFSLNINNADASTDDEVAQDQEFTTFIHDPGTGGGS